MDCFGLLNEAISRCESFHPSDKVAALNQEKACFDM
jgi:hypothetical protein